MSLSLNAADVMNEIDVQRIACFAELRREEGRSIVVRLDENISAAHKRPAPVGQQIPARQIDRIVRHHVRRR